MIKALHSQSIAAPSCASRTTMYPQQSCCCCKRKSCPESHVIQPKEQLSHSQSKNQGCSRWMEWDSLKKEQGGYLGSQQRFEANSAVASSSGTAGLTTQFYDFLTDDVDPRHERHMKLPRMCASFDIKPENENRPFVSRDHTEHDAPTCDGMRREKCPSRDTCRFFRFSGEHLQKDIISFMRILIDDQCRGRASKPMHATTYDTQQTELGSTRPLNMQNGTPVEDGLACLEYLKTSSDFILEQARILKQIQLDRYQGDTMSSGGNRSSTFTPTRMKVNSTTDFTWLEHSADGSCILADTVRNVPGRSSFSHSSEMDASGMHRVASYGVAARARTCHFRDDQARKST
jgi:hypothetical protein